MSTRPQLVSTRTILCAAAWLTGAAIVFTLTAAPANQMPEQISGAQPEWDSANQRFLVRVTARFGVAEAGESAGFDIWTEFNIHDPDGNFLATIDSLSPATIATDFPHRDRNAVPLSPSSLPWDRNGGSYSGDVMVKVTLALVNRANQILFVSEYEDLVEGVE